MLLKCIMNGLQHLAVGTKCLLYILYLLWDVIGRDMGLLWHVLISTHKNPFPQKNPWQPNKRSQLFGVVEGGG